MPCVYVHVRPHERLDLTSHLTGSRRGQSRAAVASTFTIWVANAQAELVAGTTITTVDPEAAASVGSDLGVTQFTADDPPCRATSRRRQAVFRAATGGDGQSFRSWIQILNPLIEPSKSQTGRDPRFGRLKEPLAIKHEKKFSVIRRRMGLLATTEARAPARAPHLSPLTPLLTLYSYH